MHFEERRILQHLDKEADGNLFLISKAGSRRRPTLLSRLDIIDRSVKVSEFVLIGVASAIVYHPNLTEPIDCESSLAKAPNAACPSQVAP